MNKRPTIPDLAREAGVSVSTVNRILAGSSAVRGLTMQRVQSAADRIGYFGIGAIEDRIRKATPHYRLGFLLQQSTRDLYQLFAKKIGAACRDRREEIVEPLVDFVDLLTPDDIANRLMALGKECDAVAIVAADHPIIGHSIRSLREMGKPVVTYTHRPICARTRGLCRRRQLEARAHCRFPDRPDDFTVQGEFSCSSAITAINARISPTASFRSYIREHASRRLSKRAALRMRTPAEAYRLVNGLLHTTDDLVGILIVGGELPACCAPLDKHRRIDVEALSSSAGISDLRPGKVSPKG